LSTAGTASTNCTICDAGFYHRNLDAPASQENCATCPESAECSRATTLATLALPQNHWRLTPLTTDIHRCPEQGGIPDSPCLGGVGGGGAGGGDGGNTSTRRRASESGESGAYCIAGHAGPRCEQCLADGEYFDRLTYRCRECPSPAVVIAVICGVAAAIALLVAVVVGLGRAEPENLPWMLRGTARMSRACVERFSGLVIRLGLQGKFKVVISFCAQSWIEHAAISRFARLAI
jgi:hypothetical protein